MKAQLFVVVDFYVSTLWDTFGHSLETCFLPGIYMGSYVYDHFSISNITQICTVLIVNMQGSPSLTYANAIRKSQLHNYSTYLHEIHFVFSSCAVQVEEAELEYGCLQFHQTYNNLSGAVSACVC